MLTQKNLFPIFFLILLPHLILWIFQPARWLLPILGFCKTQLLFSKKSSISLATFKNQIDQKFYKLDFDISKFNNWKWWLGDLFLKLQPFHRFIMNAINKIFFYYYDIKTFPSKPQKFFRRLVLEFRSFRYRDDCSVDLNIESTFQDKNIIQLKDSLFVSQVQGDKVVLLFNRFLGDGDLYSKLSAKYNLPILEDIEFSLLAKMNVSKEYLLKFINSDISAFAYCFDLQNGDYYSCRKKKLWFRLSAMDVFHPIIPARRVKWWPPGFSFSPNSLTIGVLALLISSIDAAMIFRDHMQNIPNALILMFFLLYFFCLLMGLGVKYIQKILFIRKALDEQFEKILMDELFGDKVNI
jgi:hypothetical protein